MFFAPIAVLHCPSDPRALWRRLLMQALSDYKFPSDDEIAQALYAVAVASGSPLIRIIDSLVDLGLRAPLSAFPKPWVAVLRGRVLDLDEREALSYRQASLAASWGWMPAPLARLSVPERIDPELDPYGADLVEIYLDNLGAAPRFGYTPTQIRLSLLRTAVGLGRPLAEVVSALVDRGLVIPASSLPETSIAKLEQACATPLLHALLTSWQSSSLTGAQIISLRQMGQ